MERDGNGKLKECLGGQGDLMRLVFPVNEKEGIGGWLGATVGIFANANTFI